MASNEILLIQPRHIYAPDPSENKLGHVYMPSSLLAAAAIFLEMEIAVKFVDENITKAKLEHNVVGINLVGAPYVARALEMERRLRDTFKNNFVLLLGGQVVAGLSRADIRSLFSQNTHNGNSYQNLGRLFKTKEEKIPKIESLSFQRAFALIDENILKRYLENEFGFYLSQGCRYSCTFCAAKRTIIQHSPNINNRMVETYRDINLALNDLDYLVRRAVGFNINKIQIYLSNLDLFQTPQKLIVFAKGVRRIKGKYPSVEIRMRGLSTTRSFLFAHKECPEVIREMIEAGLYRIGFGIDGATPKVYKETKKPQTVQESLDAIRISRNEYQLEPEALMVFGHNDKEDEKALKKAVDFCKDMGEKYGAYPRPHVAKEIIPGNDGWLNPKNVNIKKECFKNTMLFQNLDFTAVPSPITHPNAEFRKLVTQYYILACGLSNSVTKYVLAELPEMSQAELRCVRRYNQSRYDI